MLIVGSRILARDGGGMLQAEECRTNADECARLAAASVNPVLQARYRHLEVSWLYLFRLKLRARIDAKLSQAWTPPGPLPGS
jgi:hypothetical protein